MDENYPYSRSHPDTLQSSLDRMRQLLNSDRQNILLREKAAADMLKQINKLKRAAYLRGIELR
ncbi:hypothetical protein [Mesorhizobium sp. CN2-181]|uniref:hypothetical protein n=1 Tax=Mesorhizobium yinganensis TaxID=3157707 RepID=UPI0032B7966E